jgi:hypothetical protein
MVEKGTSQPNTYVSWGKEAIILEEASEMNRGSVFFRTIVTVVGLVSAAQAVPVEWPVAAGGNGHLYEAVSVPEAITWTAASQAAEAAGGYLATITSQEENDFVFNLVDDEIYWHWNGNAGEGPWLGGYQLDGASEPDGGWVWVTGEPLSYTNWDVVQPNNKYINENRIHFFGGDVGQTPVATWNDIYDDPAAYGFGDFAVHGYVIEVPEPGTVLLLAFGGLAVLRKRRR